MTTQPPPSLTEFIKTNTASITTREAHDKWLFDNVAKRLPQLSRKNPYSGKNHAQRRRLLAAFSSVNNNNKTYLLS